MEIINRRFLLNKRKLFRAVFGVFSLSGIMFVFQACYGTPQDFGMDVTIKGKVISAVTKAPIPGIKVQVNPAGQYVQSNQDGDFSIYCERVPEYNLVISDMDGTQNGKYAACDTTVQLTDQAESLTVNIEMK